MREISIERLRALLRYDHATGDLHWLERRSVAKAGDLAGSVKADGYRHIGVDGTVILAHRASWAIVHGAWPTFPIDHIDGNRTNNRIQNLRDGSRLNAQNLRAPRSDSTSGLLGVSWHGASKKWVAQITVNAKRKHLGTFESADVAHSAYLAAKRVHHAGCTI